MICGEAGAKRRYGVVKDEKVLVEGFEHGLAGMRRRKGHMSRTDLSDGKSNERLGSIDPKYRHAILGE